MSAAEAVRLVPKERRYKDRYDPDVDLVPSGFAVGQPTLAECAPYLKK